ncbi:MAG: DNA/RNA non-specific endonuclease [Clostridia bacterium]|nr:DNA/RNA non-specific endonuclease [Clostridia bacterium]
MAKNSRPKSAGWTKTEVIILVVLVICYLVFGLFDNPEKNISDVANENQTQVEETQIEETEEEIILGPGSEAELPFVDDPFDSDGTLKESVRYKTGEYDYYYETDEEGRIVLFETDDLELTTRDERLPHDGNTPGKIKGDHAGHLAGDRFGGSPHIDNLVSQSAKVNLSTYKKMENAWAAALEDGKEVTVEVEVIYTDEDMRPDEFDVEYTIDGEYFTQHLIN